MILQRCNSTVGLVTNLPLFLPVRPSSELRCTSDGGLNQAMSTFFYFKKALTNCPPLPGVESLPLVLMLYILAFSDQFGGPSGHDSRSASSWSNFPSVLLDEAEADLWWTILWTCLEV